LEKIGFHTYEYSQNFLQTVLRFLGYRNEMGKILTEDRVIKVGTFPMGINFQKFYLALENNEIFERVQELTRK
jgi:trehalose 6-phosphate synthase/phosphatase